MSESTKCTLNEGEPHPSAYAAKEYLSSLGATALARYLEAFSSCSLLLGSREAEICADTLSRLINAQPVNDRYLLGLAWAIRDMEEITDV